MSSGSSRQHPKRAPRRPDPDGAIVVGALSTGQSSSSRTRTGDSGHRIHSSPRQRRRSAYHVIRPGSTPGHRPSLSHHSTRPWKGNSPVPHHAPVFSESPIADYLVAETRPGVEVVTEQAIIDSALDEGYCGYHAVGTCAMGPSDDDVVDHSLLVRGVRNLRVMDCSVMPTMVSGNLNGPAMAMAWRAADLILAAA